MAALASLVLTWAFPVFPRQSVEYGSISGRVLDPSHAAVPGAQVTRRLTNGFQLSGMLQAYSALPFNILSGVTTIHGTPGRPIVEGEFIERNAGSSSAFFSLNLRVSRTFRLTLRLQLEGMVEGFNVTNHTNVVTRNTVFGTGAYPTEPLPAFGQPTNVGEPRSLQVSARIRF
jgi:hypothetical protein